jgi:hypothetical protein
MKAPGATCGRQTVPRNWRYDVRVWERQLRPGKRALLACDDRADNLDLDRGLFRARSGRRVMLHQLRLACRLIRGQTQTSARLVELGLSGAHIDLEDVGIQLEQDVSLRDALARHEQNPTHRAIDLRRDLHELACDDHAVEFQFESFCSAREQPD